MAEITKKMVLDIDSSASYKSVKELRNELKNIKDGMAGLQEGSDAFLEMANKAGEVKHQLDAINQATRAASKDFGDLMSNTAKVGAGMVGSFQAVKGAMTLLGVESENVEAAIQKMQASMAIVQGLQSIDGGIKSFKTLTTAIGAATSGMNKFKVALVATGLGALVVVIASIVANWEEFSEALGISSKQMEKFGDMAKGVFNAVLKGVGGLGKALSRLLRGDLEGAKTAAADAMDFQKNYADGVERSITQRVEEETKKRLEAETTAMKKAMEARWALYEAELQREADEELATDILDKIWEKANAEHPVKSLKDYILPKDEEEDEDIDKWLNDRLNAIEYAKGLIGTTYLETINAQQQALNDMFEQGLIDEKRYNDASNALAKERASYHMQMAGAAAQGIANILNTLADNEDANSKEGFERQKKLQIASATMSMLGGITEALSGTFTTHSGVWDIVLAGIQAAGIAAAGAVQISNIKKQKFGDTNTPTVTPRISSEATSAISSPVQYTQDVQGASIEQTIKDTRVYVTESDISDTQKRVNVAESEARF